MTERWTARWFRKRALLYHLLVMILAPGCLWAGWWQTSRAESGNTLSYLYAFEWPIFAVLAVIGWWQLIHEDPAAVDSRKVERARRANDRGPFVPPPPDADSGFAQPLGAGRRWVLEAAGERRNDVVLIDAAATVDDTDGRPPDATTPDHDPAVHALSSYNAYLARLSAGGGRKSWRNPHGLAARTRRIDPPPAASVGGRTLPATDGASPIEVGPAAGRLDPADRADDGW